MSLVDKTLVRKDTLLAVIVCVCCVIWRQFLLAVACCDAAERCGASKKESESGCRDGTREKSFKECVTSFSGF